MTDQQLKRDMPRRTRWRRLTNLAATAALGLGSLALAGCGDGEEELPPMEEPAGEESSSIGGETSMEQESSMNSEDPVMQQDQAQQDQTMDPESSMDSEAASDESTSSPESSGSQENDDQSGN